MRYFILFFISFLLSSCVMPAGYVPNQIKLKIGDDLAWKAKNFDDSNWKTSHKTMKMGRLWVRAKIRFDSVPNPSKPLGVFIAAVGSYDCYLDGQYIGSSGKIGNNKSEEIPGSTISYFQIPDSLADKGEHIFALRISNYYAEGKVTSFQFLVSNYFQMVRAPLIFTAFMYILAGVFLIAAVYYSFIYIKYKREFIFFVFSLICYLFFALIILEFLKFYILYPYQYHYPRMDLIRWMTIILVILVPYFFSLQFPFRGFKIYLGFHLALLAIIIASLYGHYDELAQTASLLMLISSVIIVGIASYTKKKGASIVLGGLLLCILFVFFLFYDISLFLSFGVIALLMLYLLAIRMQEQRKTLEFSKLQSARLEAELLKKNIQPHFLMNTLTSLIDWVEESPQNGIHFIEALAREFELLGQIANKTLIPIEQEIELCKTHLNVMKYRKEIDYQWIDEGIDLKEKIPPALIHTALENGIKHNAPRKDGSIVFKLKLIKKSGIKKYILSTFGKPISKTANGQEGTGHQYIKARLNESYGMDWEFHSRAIDNGWQTTIIIK